MKVARWVGMMTIVMMIIIFLVDDEVDNGVRDYDNDQINHRNDDQISRLW